MCRIKAQLSVFFEEPFWIGIYEREENNQIEVCKIVFGSEPKDYEVYSYLNECWGNLKFSPPVEASKQIQRKINPKRMQRQIAMQLHNPGIGTKAQQALKALQEERKTERKRKTKDQKYQEKKRQFELRSQKKKEKHKGR